MKQLNGKVLADYIKERQARDVRRLTHSGVQPKLAIVQTKDDPVINTYVKLKKAYGADIGASVEVHAIAQDKAAQVITRLNSDQDVKGIIVQLPLPDPSQTDEIVNMVAPGKDVDALGLNASFEPATPMAIMWLLSGYNIDLTGKEVLIIGQGKLVGKPLLRILNDSGVEVNSADSKTNNLNDLAMRADIIVTATGSPGVLKANMIKPGAVVVDAGVASESGKTVGDLDLGVYERDDLIVTPPKGGVGPLTICALFENLIAASKQK